MKAIRNSNDDKKIITTTKQTRKLRTFNIQHTCTCTKQSNQYAQSTPEATVSTITTSSQP